MAREMEIQIMGMDSNMDPSQMMAQGEAEGMVDQLRMAEDAEMSAMAPTGNFSKVALNSLVRAHNKVSSLFDMETYPDFSEGLEEFPANFVRELMMIAQAVSDAIDEDVLEGEMMIDLEGVSSDRDLALLAGRLESISRSKDFKRFLKEGSGLSEEGDDKDRENFKPHMMYDPNSDKSEMANTFEDHERLDKMGYTHEKKEDEDMGDDEIEELMKRRV